MNILVLATDYPKPNGYVASYFIHIRNKAYLSSGIEVTVINFKSNESYTVDGINVISVKDYKNFYSTKKFDMLLSHAPNIRNHYRFLKKYGERFKDIIFFFHGHEVLKTNEVYPTPYSYSKKRIKLVVSLQNLYDEFKFILWRKYYYESANKSQFVFVSKWMYDMFFKYINIEEKHLSDRIHIIYNCVGEIFQTQKYLKDTTKKYDFITIRNILDNSKYGIDIVSRIAETNPKYRFLLVGRGDYFKHNSKPNNLELIDKHLSHQEIIDYLNMSRCALMPTRADAQGLMMCEMATFGIPVITSDIPVCHEVMSVFPNVRFINNNAPRIEITNIYEELKKSEYYHKIDKYFDRETMGKEIELFNKLRGNTI